ncbi:MAG: hypothetical protein OCD01_02220 [Fibrobacterales bacterium]
MKLFLFCITFLFFSCIQPTSNNNQDKIQILSISPNTLYIQDSTEITIQLSYNVGSAVESVMIFAEADFTSPGSEDILAVKFSDKSNDTIELKGIAYIPESNTSSNLDLTISVSESPESLRGFTTLGSEIHKLKVIR